MTKGSSRSVHETVFAPSRLGPVFKVRAALQIARAQALLELGDLQDAEDDVGAALRLAKELGARDVEANGHLTLARCNLAKHETDAAEEAAEDALSLGSQMELPEVVWQAHDLLAHSAQSRGDSDEAAGHWRSAIKVIEKLRSESLQMRSKEDTVLEDQRRAAVYSEMVKSLLVEGKLDEAKDLVERASWPPLEATLRSVVQKG